MPRAVVAGIGSPFGVDRLGWEVLELLKTRPEWGPANSAQVSFCICDRPGPMLLEQLRGAELAIVVDAMQGGMSPGCLLRLEGESIARAPLRVSSHGFGLADTLALGRSLGDLPPRVIALGVEVGQATGRAPAREDVERLAEAVRAEIETFLEHHTVVPQSQR